MKKEQYQRWICIFLGLIALNLSLLSLHHLGILPSFSVKQSVSSSVVPATFFTHTDGVLKVRFAEDVMPVRIQEVDNFIFGKLPVELRDEPLRVEVQNQPLNVRLQP